MPSESFAVPRDLSQLESTTAIAVVTADRIEHAGAEAASAFEHALEAAAEQAGPDTRPSAPAVRYVPAKTAGAGMPEQVPAISASAAEPPRAEAIRTARTLADFNVRAMEAMRANVAATMHFWSAMTGARTLSEAIALNAAHMRKQIETMTVQGRELSGLARALWADAAQGATRSGREP